VEREYLHVIGLGSREDWQAGRGSIYYIEDRKGEKAMPVFTTPEKVKQYISANIDAPNAHMDMLESVPESHVGPLTEGGFIVMPLDEEGVAQAAAMVGADYLIRDSRLGEQQEILRLT